MEVPPPPPRVIQIPVHVGLLNFFFFMDQSFIQEVD